MNTSIMTRVMEMRADVISAMASMAACLAEVYPWSSLACTASTTTIASSTTIAIANTRAERVSRFSEKPKMYRRKNVPMRATGMAISGMRVERKSCRKTNTTRNTSTKASSRVLMTSWMDANRKSLTLRVVERIRPLGRSLRHCSMFFSSSSITCVALEPADWKMMQEVAVLPFWVLAKP